MPFDVIFLPLIFINLSKRRRNTAASARFRMKKKEREQALEKNTREFACPIRLLCMSLIHVAQLQKCCKIA